MNIHTFEQETPAFTCPECGSHKFGLLFSSPRRNAQGYLTDQGPSTRYCQGWGCKFRWVQEADPQVFK